MKFKCKQGHHLVKFKVSLFVEGAVFEFKVSLFVAGAVFGEVWNDSRSAKGCSFPYKMLMVSAAAGCGLTVSFSDHGRIKLGSWSEHARIGLAM